MPELFDCSHGSFAWRSRERARANVFHLLGAWRRDVPLSSFLHYLNFLNRVLLKFAKADRQDAVFQNGFDVFFGDWNR